jgi:hypothetical protein
MMVRRMKTQGFPESRDIAVLGEGPVPGFFGPAYADAAMDKTALVGLDAPGNDIAHHKARAQYDKALARQNIPEYNPADSNQSAAHVAFHSGPFPNNHAAFGFYIPQHIAVHAGKSPGFYIPCYAGSGAYNGIDGEVFVFGSHTL